MSGAKRWPACWPAPRSPIKARARSRQSAGDVVVMTEISAVESLDCVRGEPPKLARLDTGKSPFGSGVSSRRCPLVSDADYDALKRRNDAIEQRFSSLDPRRQSEAGASARHPAEGFGKVRHARPMLSLDNAFDENDVREFDARLRRFPRLIGGRASRRTGEPNPKSTGSRSVYATNRAVLSKGRPVATGPRARM